LFLGGALHQGKKISENCICSGGACIHAFGRSFSPEFQLCSFAEVVEPFCLTLRSRQFWSILSRLCRAIAFVLGDRDLSYSSDLFLTFGWLLITCLSFSFVYFLFLFYQNWLLVCVVNALIKGGIEDRSVREPADGRSLL
jgi:hypothetical protein